MCDCCCPLPQLHGPLGAGTLRWTTGQVWSLVWWLRDRGWPWRRGVPCAVASSAPQPWPSFIASRGGAPHGPPERMEDLSMGSSPSSWMFIPYTLPSLTPSQAPSPVGLVILFFFFFSVLSHAATVSPRGQMAVFVILTLHPQRRVRAITQSPSLCKCMMGAAHRGP